MEPKAASPALNMVQDGGKAAMMPPKVTTDENVELGNMQQEDTKLPLHEDIMQLSRLGEIGPIQKLFESGKIGSDFHDEEGITPLHVRHENACVTLSTSLTRLTSGRPSTTTMLCASTWSRRGSRLTPKEERLLRPQRCGLLRDAITTS